MSTEVGPTNIAAAQTPDRFPVKWREVVLFGLLAYGLAWVWSGFFLLPYLGDLLTQPTTPTDLVDRLGVVSVLPTMLAPMMAALIMRLFVSKEGLEGALVLVGSWEDYLAGRGGPAVFGTGVVGSGQALSLGEFS